MTPVIRVLTPRFIFVVPHWNNLMKSDSSPFINANSLKPIQQSDTRNAKQNTSRPVDRYDERNQSAHKSTAILGATHHNPGADIFGLENGFDERPSSATPPKQLPLKIAF